MSLLVSRSASRSGNTLALTDQLLRWMTTHSHSSRHHHPHGPGLLQFVGRAHPRREIKPGWRVVGAAAVGAQSISRGICWAASAPLALFIVVVGLFASSTDSASASTPKPPAMSPAFCRRVSGPYTPSCTWVTCFCSSPS